MNLAEIRITLLISFKIRVPFLEFRTISDTYIRPNTSNEHSSTTRTFEPRKKSRRFTTEPVRRESSAAEAGPDNNTQTGVERNDHGFL